MTKLGLVQLLVIALLLAGWLATAGASTIGISSYEVINELPSGFGSWHHTSTTLNDGILSTDNQNTLLIYNPDTQIVLHLAQTATISSLFLYSFDDHNNVIPGNMTDITVIINGSPEAIHLGPGFGPIGFSGYSVNEVVSLGLPLSQLVTDSVILTGFRSTGLLFDYSSISEIVVNGDAAAVPEPSTLILLGVGFAGVGLLRRRQGKG